MTVPGEDDVCCCTLSRLLECRTITGCIVKYGRKGNFLQDEKKKAVVYDKFDLLDVIIAGLEH